MVAQVSSKVKTRFLTLTDHTDPVRVAAVAAAGLLTSVLVALGVSGDMLTSLIRNKPILMGISVTLVLFGVLWPFTAPKGLKRRATGILVLIVGVLSLAATAIIGYATIREQPSLTLAPHWSASTPGEVTISVKAGAISQAAEDEFLLRVIGVKDDSTAVAKDNCQSILWGPVNAAESDVIYRATSGPSKAGGATVEADIPLSSDEYNFVCAYASTRHKDDGEAQRGAVALLSLNRSSVGASATPTASPSPTSTTVRVKIWQPNPRKTVTKTTTTSR